MEAFPTDLGRVGHGGSVDKGTAEDEKGKMANKMVNEIMMKKRSWISKCVYNLKPNIQ